MSAVATRLKICLRRAAIPLMGSLVLAACSSGVYSVVQKRGYDPAEFRYAAQDKALRTEIHGNPFETEDGAFREAVSAAMQPGHWGFDVIFTPRTRLTDQPDERARSEYFVAVTFDTNLDDGPALCAGETDSSDGASTAEGIVDARMAFCRDGQLLSTTRGVVQGVAGPADGRFVTMIARMTRELFPQRDYLDDDGPAGGNLF